MTIPDFTGIDLGAPAGSGDWGPGPAAWDAPEGIAVKPLYTAADLHGVDGYVFAGCDALDVLRTVHDELGVQA